MAYQITSTTCHIKPPARGRKGKISGSITACVDGRKYKVRYEADGDGGNSFQWGATTEILCFTYTTFERLIQEAIACPH